MTGLDNQQHLERNTVATSASIEHVSLSQSVQSFYQPINYVANNRLDLPSALDLGSMAELYNLPQFDSIQSNFKKSTVEQLAMNDDYLNRERKNLEPQDGDSLPLKQVLENYKTPFMDAYNRSKLLKDGEPGKSKTLEDIVDRLKDCPWADKIHVKFDSKALNPEYDPVKNTITINPNRLPDAQLETFAHEAYHATHQFLNKMYSGTVLDKKQFTDTLLWGEVGSMVAEAKVHDELKLSTEKPQFFYKNADGSDSHINIGDYVKQHGMKALFDFLETAQPARSTQEPYGIHYQKNHQEYSDRFNKNRPDALKMIQDWVNKNQPNSEI